MKETQDRVIGTLYLVFAPDMTVEGSCRPEGSLGASRVLKLFKDLFFLFLGDKPFPSCSLFYNKTINAVGVEGSDNLLDCVFEKIEGTHGLFPGTAREKQDNHRTLTIGFSVLAGTLGGIKIG